MSRKAAWFRCRIFPLLAACIASAAWYRPAPANEAGDIPNKPLRVVVTIKPVHSLAAAVLDGVAIPKLLLTGASSPHSYALRPSDSAALSEADVIVRVAETLEVFLAKAIETLPRHARVVTLENTPGLKLYRVRENGDFEADDGDNGDGNAGHDVHFWLDAINAMAIADTLAAAFAEADPGHGETFKANAAALKAKLGALDTELRDRLSEVSQQPFVVFHDVAQYLEKRYNLHATGAVTLSPERAPGAKRLTEIRAKIVKLGAICVFSEPQFPPKLVETLIENTAARAGVLDEIGAGIPEGPDHYARFMRANAESLATCLTPRTPVP